MKAFIFDLDGVLVDTAKYHFLAWGRLAEELGIPFTEEDNEHLKGISRVKSLDIILEIGKKSISQEQKDDLLQRKNDWYVEYINQLDHSQILPGVESFLSAAKEDGLRLAVGSASKNAPRILEKLGLNHFFEILVDGNMVTRAKPNPEVFTKAADHMGVPYSDCVVFEDAQAGVEAANAAGMYSVAIDHKDVLKGAKLTLHGFGNTTYHQFKDLI
jgi:beta-phosphoglucomutase